MDFVTYSFISGREFRPPTIINNYFRECSAIEVDTSLGARRVIEVPERQLQGKNFPLWYTALFIMN